MPKCGLKDKKTVVNKYVVSKDANDRLIHFSSVHWLSINDERYSIYQ